MRDWIIRSNIKIFVRNWWRARNFSYSGSFLAILQSIAKKCLRFVTYWCGLSDGLFPFCNGWRQISFYIIINSNRIILKAIKRLQFSYIERTCSICFSFSSAHHRILMFYDQVAIDLLLYDFAYLTWQIKKNKMRRIIFLKYKF